LVGLDPKNELAPLLLRATPIVLCYPHAIRRGLEILALAVAPTGFWGSSWCRRHSGLGLWLSDRRWGWLGRGRRTGARSVVCRL